MLMKSAVMVAEYFGFVFSNEFNFFAGFRLPKLDSAMYS